MIHSLESVPLASNNSCKTTLVSSCLRTGNESSQRLSGFSGQRLHTSYSMKASGLRSSKESRLICKVAQIRSHAWGYTDILKIKLMLPCSLRLFRPLRNQARHQLATHLVIESASSHSSSPNVSSSCSSLRPHMRCFKMKTSTRRSLPSIYCVSCRFWMPAINLHDRSMQTKRSGMDYGVSVSDLEPVPLTTRLMVFKAL